MLGNLKNPPEPFGDVIRTHFRLKARSVTKQLDEWLAQDDGRPIQGDGAPIAAKVVVPGAASGSSTAFQSDVNELKGLLQKLLDGGNVSGTAGSSSAPS